MIVQILRDLRRAPSRQILRRGDNGPPRLAQSARRQRTVGQRSEPDGDIGLARRHIDHDIGQVEVD